MARAPIPTWFFALVIVKKGHRFLLVHEHGGGWYLPAGRVEPGETVVEAAHRETLEEAGIPIVVEGILRIQHTPRPDGSSRVRFIFLARPRDDTPPKREPDEDSLEARFVTIEELDEFPLRGEEVRELLQEVSAGAFVCPLSVLGREV